MSRNRRNALLCSQPAAVRAPERQPVSGQARERPSGNQLRPLLHHVQQRSPCCHRVPAGSQAGSCPGPPATSPPSGGAQERSGHGAAARPRTGSPAASRGPARAAAVEVRGMRRRGRRVWQPTWRTHPAHTPHAAHWRPAQQPQLTQKSSPPALPRPRLPLRERAGPWRLPRCGLRLRPPKSLLLLLRPRWWRCRRL